MTLKVDTLKGRYQNAHYYQVRTQGRSALL